MLISRDMGVKGCFSQPKIFKIIFSFLGQKIIFKNIYHTLEDFSKFNRPFKSTVYWEKWPINPLKDTPDPWIKPSKLWDVGLSSGYPNVPELAHICSWLSNGAPVGARGAAKLPAHGSNLKGMEIHGYEGNYYNMNYPSLIVSSLTIIICWAYDGAIFPSTISAKY